MREGGGFQTLLSLPWMSFSRELAEVEAFGDFLGTGLLGMWLGQALDRPRDSWAPAVPSGTQGVVGIGGRTGLSLATRTWPGIAKLPGSHGSSCRADGEAEALQAGTSPRPQATLGKTRALALGHHPFFWSPMAHCPSRGTDRGDGPVCL